jgi:hypothetical protein
MVDSAAAVGARSSLVASFVTVAVSSASTSASRSPVSPSWTLASTTNVRGSVAGSPFLVALPGSTCHDSNAPRRARNR